MLGLSWLTSSGTVPAGVLYDTLKLVEGSRLYLGGQKFKYKKDTIIVIHGGLDYRVTYPRGQASEIFFDSLEERASRKRWTRELHNIVITSPRIPDTLDTMLTRLSVDPYINYGGKVIRNIRFIKLEPFGPSIFDTSRIASSKIEKFGNDLHRVTHDRVIKNHLLFQRGDLVVPHEISDNERIIRELSFIEDVRIYLEELTPGSDTVDVRVVTKDAFSIGAGGWLNGFDVGKLDIFESNLFGSGHELHAVFYWDGEKSPWLGHEIYYLMHNLGGSFINGMLRYQQVFNTESYQLGFDRRFFTPNTKWAGALDLERTRTLRYIPLSDSLSIDVPVKYNIYDGWLGRAFYLRSQRNQIGNRLNFVVSSRLYWDQYIDRPEVDEKNFYVYQNRTGWLTSLAISSQSFFRSNLILDFGRTEDIPQGMLFSITGGVERNEFNTRLYAGFSLSQGRYLGNIGYLYTKLEAGGFFLKKDYVEQGVINFRADYFTPLFIINRFKFRHFISANFVNGINRFEDEYIGIGDDHDIRGFRYGLPLGTKKIFLNYEADAFTPFYLYGFRFVFFGFMDFGLIGPETKKLHDGLFYSGFGIGARIRNERLVFETITIRLGYYPNHPEKDIPLFLHFSGEQRYNIDNFNVTKPEIASFR
ncbi:MAG: hypothetical protein AMS26_18265 [Bacteroides sp. SM23_62]|nr:MAG: hypothetical protein AMS26_18265 [Bacteroides sp. SM23_62]